MSMNAIQRHRIQVQTGDGFSAALAHFADKIAGRAEAVLEQSAQIALESIRDGSPLTGSPGQPELTGALKKSWRIRRVGMVAFVESTSPYARVVEYNVKKRVRFSRRRKRARSVYGRAYSSGGPYSMTLTRMAFPRIVEEARRRAVAMVP